jgi:hypothetical protein
MVETVDRPNVVGFDGEGRRLTRALRGVLAGPLVTWTPRTHGRTPHSLRANPRKLGASPCQNCHNMSRPMLTSLRGWGTTNEAADTIREAGPRRGSPRCVK